MSTNTNTTITVTASQSQQEAFLKAAAERLRWQLADRIQQCSGCTYGPQDALFDQDVDVMLANSQGARSALERLGS